MTGAPAMRFPKTGDTHFPLRQMTILALCRFCEPIAFTSIFPYVYYMVQDFGVAKHQSEISIYTGMVTSAFALAEFSSGVAWGKLSDRIGRKPVLLAGLAGTALSMLIFGLAPSLPIALLARALGGLLNGNIGVLQTTVAEIVTVKEHQPRAYTIMPFVWCLGSILGPMLGGALARPVISYPSIFAADSIWARYPYLLPNLICTIIVTLGVIVGILFLEETHAVMKNRPDPGLEAGKWIMHKLSWWARATLPTESEKDEDIEEIIALLHDNHPPGYCSTSASPEQDDQESTNLITSSVDKPQTAKIFTKQVVLNIVGYGILAYHTMSLDSMLPTLLSAPVPHDEDNRHLPFKFISGYGLSTKQIGVILSIQGAYSIFATVFLFPIFVRRMGALGLFRAIAISYPILYFLVPYFTFLPSSLKIAGIYLLVIWKSTFATMAYPSNAILLTNSAPSLLMLGTINGVAASTASLSRAFGPTISGLLISAGEKVGCSGLAWWCSAAISISGALISLRMANTDGGYDVDEKIEEDPELCRGEPDCGVCNIDPLVASAEENVRNEFQSQ
ncbi:Major facilitator superfamily multidrug transporter [Podosphaera aphanis]|nr:Major facilitator superfamily multidrug transporter [Podosphaera aphanis]